MIIKDKEKKLNHLHNSFKKETDIHTFLEDLLRRMGFKDVIITHEQGNYPENGKDLVCSFFDIFEDKKDWYAFVVKKGTISGTSAQINEIESQIKDCFKYEYKSLKTTSERVRISKVKVVTNEHFSTGAKDKILLNDEINKANVDFWDDEKLIQLIDRYDPGYWRGRAYMLNKLRHEIPSSCHIIDINIKEISKYIDNRDYQAIKLPQRVNEILINTRRIDNVVSFFSTIDLDDERFLEFPHPFILRDYMNDQLDLFRQEASYRGIDIRCNIENNTPSLMVSDYYSYAIMNIITNAIRFAAPGTCVWIQSNSEEISISDIGIQIKDTEMTEIFREGYRSVAAKGINERGMGYGLYLVKRVLDAYGHQIQVTCENVSNRNIFAERMVSQIITDFSLEERKKYVLSDTFPEEETEVWRRVDSIKKSDSLISPQYRSFINDDKKSSMLWFEYHRKYGPSFFVMEDDYFCQPVYNVTFTIKLPQ